MGAVENVDAVRRLEIAYGARNYEVVRAILAEDVVCHTPGSEMMQPGVEGCIAANEGGFMSFPDKSSEVLDAFGEGDRVVSRVRMTGTNQGGLPWAGVPANGNAVDVEWIQVSRHEDDGRIAETWAQMDVPKMMVQLGAMPAPEGM